jgi:DNA-binding MarR family transcriptional regulator
MTKAEVNKTEQKKTNKDPRDNSDGRYDALKLENQLCFPLYAAARAVVRNYTPYLKPLGLTYTQYIVLLVLWENDNIRVSSLCERLHLDNGTVTPVLKKMEKNGLLIRNRLKDDERVVIVSLTDEGWAMREKALSVPEKLGCGCCFDLGQEDSKTLSSLLYRILNEIDIKQ